MSVRKAAIAAAMMLAGAEGVEAQAARGSARGEFIAHVTGTAQMSEAGRITTLKRGVRVVKSGCDIRSTDTHPIILMITQTAHVSVDSAMGWYPVRMPDHPGIAVLRRQDVVRELGLRAGRSRATPTRVLWPAEAFPWSAQHSGMIWTADSTNRRDKVMVIEAGDESGDYSYPLGEKSGMRRHVELEGLLPVGVTDTTLGADGSMRLEFALLGRSQPSFIVLRLLGSQENRKLAGDLEAYAAGDSLDRALGRATAFIRNRLVGDAAIEYEQALLIAPDFPELVAKLIDTHRAYGNEPRARELEARATPP